MDETGKNCILFFVKYPEEGQVKTRLAAQLNEKFAVELYGSFVLDLLSMLEQYEGQLQICFFPADSQAKFVKWLGNRYSYMPQQGEDLGQRMQNAFIQAFDHGFKRAILIGSDIPNLSSATIAEAFSSLKTHDAVIGPAHDGGYYLIGFNRNAFLPGAFGGIEWSTDTVCTKTLRKLEDSGLGFHRLPELRDIDVLTDLERLCMENRNSAFLDSRTGSCILKNDRLRTLLVSPP